MGLFSKIKNMFKSYKEESEQEEKEQEEISKEEENPDTMVEESVDESSINNEDVAFGDEEPEEEDEDEDFDNQEDDLAEEAADQEDEEVEEEIETEVEEEPESEEEEIEEESDIEEESEEEEEIEIDEEPEDEEIEDEEETEPETEPEIKPVKEKKGLFGIKKKNKEEELKKSIKVYEKGLSKSRKGFVSKLADLTNKYNKITDEYFDELEEILIMADIGVNTVMSFIDRLRDRVRKENITSPADLKEIIVDELFIIYVNDEVLSTKINFREDGPTVILFIGVNGVGKTTTIAKLANKFKDDDRKVLLVGADTFRAGAIEQLKEWSERVGVGFYGKEQSDPASVVYDGIELAKKEKYDTVLIDTAGRLQNKVNLMKELEKINKVIGDLVDGGASETLLVIDATTGQNGVIQAKAFKEITDITGIVLTKLDGTAKGGIVLAIKEEVNIPVKYIGLGETKDDLQEFDIEKYIYGLFKDMM